MDIERLREIATGADFDTLIGQVENDWFDCKKEPYQTQNDSAKRELAKDVSSFANMDGGFIFIGVRTKRSDEHFGDEVDAIHPFAQSLVDVVQYRNILNTWVFPEIEALDIRWIEMPTKPQSGIVVITIPKQKDSTKPFLISKVLDEKKQVEMMFGFAQRKGDSSKPLSVGDLQKALRSGLHFEERLEERFDGMEALFRGTVQNNDSEVQKKSNGERIEQRIEYALEYEELKDGRNITIAAQPNQPTQLKSIFLSTEGSIRKQLENPPVLRRGGWNLRTLDQAKIVKGEMIRVGNGSRIVVDLYRDGTLVFAGLGNHEFLAWHKEDKQKINPVALIEIVYSFLVFYQLVLADAEQLPTDFTLRLDLKNLHLGGVKTSLAPYALESMAQMFDGDAIKAPDDSMCLLKTFSTTDYDPALLGYEIIKEVYLWFGIEEDKIPYTKDENGIKTLDVSSFAGI